MKTVKEWIAQGKCEMLAKAGREVTNVQIMSNIIRISFLSKGKKKFMIINRTSADWGTFTVKVY